MSKKNRRKTPPDTADTTAQKQPVEAGTTADEQQKPETRAETAQADPQAQPAPPAEKAPDAGGNSKPPDSLPVTLENIAQIVNIQTGNIKTLAEHLSVIEQQLGVFKASRDGAAASRNASDAPGAPPQNEPPQWLRDLAPLAAAAITRFLQGPEEKPKSKLAELVENRLAAKVDAMLEKSLENVLTAMDAADEGRLQIQPRAEPKEMR